MMIILSNYEKIVVIMRNYRINVYKELKELKKFKN